MVASMRSSDKVSRSAGDLRARPGSRQHDDSRCVGIDVSSSGLFSAVLGKVPGEGDTFAFGPCDQCGCRNPIVLRRVALSTRPIRRDS